LTITACHGGTTIQASLVFSFCGVAHNKFLLK
jgi:hypothetical protein